jgi:hypothetical protein
MATLRLPVPLSVTVADTSHESGSVKASVMASLTGVIESEPPEVVAVWPPWEQVAFQATVALWLGLAVAPTVTVSGPVIVWVSVHDALAPDASQKPATLAAATSTVAVTAPAARRPATTA